MKKVKFILDNINDLIKEVKDRKKPSDSIRSVVANWDYKYQHYIVEAEYEENNS